jgi:methylated-DNA-[protein]-cysteine S-methyltransferase
MNEGKLAVFPSDLGWIAVAWKGRKIGGLTFGHGSPQDAASRLAGCGSDPSGPDDFLDRLVARLRAFAEGNTRDRFLDVSLDIAHMTDFQRSVIHHCRRIRAGSTLSYGELAALAGRPKAARAAGHVMATNRFPLIVPCHRVIASNRRLGGYSAPEGLAMKRRLLATEGVHL